MCKICIEIQIKNTTMKQTKNDWPNADLLLTENNKKKKKKKEKQYNNLCNQIDIGLYYYTMFLSIQFKIEHEQCALCPE